MIGSFEIIKISSQLQENLSHGNVLIKKKACNIILQNLLVFFKVDCVSLCSKYLES